MTSTHHAELYQLNECAKEAAYFRNFCSELGSHYTAHGTHIELLSDNEKAVETAKGTVVRSNSRHYDLAIFYQRELFIQGWTYYTFCRGTYMPADLFTKGGHSEEHFNTLRELLAVLPQRHN